MTDLEIKLDLDGHGGAEIRRLFARIADPEPPLHDLGEFKRRRIVLAMPRMPRGERSTPGQPPARRSNLFAQRITWNIADAQLDVGTYDVRGRLLQYGGTIRPKTAKALTVPIHPDAYGKRARDFDNLTFIPRKNAPPLLVRKVGQVGRVRQRWDIMFVLLKSVTIKPRPYLWWDEDDTQYLLLSLRRRFESPQ